MASWQPKVSIVIPVYNGSNYLAQAIESALHQTYQNMEIIVINDGSTDNGATEAIARSYGPRIRYIAKDNEGIAATLNRGIQEMSGEYFSWLSHDDLYLPDKISQQVEILRELSDKNSVIYGDYDLINEYSEVIGERIVPPEPPNRFYFSLFLRFPVHACTALFPKIVFDNVGGFDAAWKFLQDTNMWFRLAPHISFIHGGKKFAQVRMHGERGTVTRTKLGYAEGNKLYTEETAKLSPDDIKIISGLLPYNFYLQCAESYRVKSYYQAAFFALSLARQTKEGRRFLSGMRILLFSMAYWSLMSMQKIKLALLH